MRELALKLMRIDESSEYNSTRALQILQEDLERDVPFLASLGWAPRSLAAVVWAGSDSLSSDLGVALAGDSDFRVRRALAEALHGQQRNARTSSTVDKLLLDARFSVRKWLKRPA